jgi:parallel beta-helix repeat protein/predicted outer membrane repeat protein
MRTIDCLITAVLILVSMSSATIINVPGDYSTIQAGLNAAVQGDTVLVQPGTYVENIVWPPVNSIKLFSAGDSSNTVIDGDSASSVIYFPETGNIDTTTVVRGFKITNGGNVGHGGGIYLSQSSPTIEGCIVSGNSATYNGGGIYLPNSGANIMNCTISGNSADDDGGGLYCVASNATIADCNISTNTVYLHGGGIYCLNSNVTIENCTVTENSAERGGGIHCEDSDIPIIRCTIGANSAFFGGGICCVYCNPTIENCTISENSTPFMGGGIYGFFSDFVIRNCTLSGNFAYSAGGGIFCERSDAIIERCTITADSAHSGGGINCYYSAPDLTETLLDANFASGYGGALRCHYASVSIEHCTISNNNAGIEGDGIYADGNWWPTISYNNIFQNGVGICNMDSTQVLDCPNNWWGDPSGPYHPTLNPNGLGDSTNAYVNPIPFLTEPDSLAPPAGSTEHHFQPPTSFRLYPNYPNPFNATTTIAFGLPMISKVTLKVYNILGQVVATIIEDKMLSSGRHEVTFSDKNLSSGVYFYQLTAGRNTAIGKMVLLK